MAKILKNRINQILDHNIDHNFVYSVFDKWLSDEECTDEVMSYRDVNSFDQYKRFKDIEYNYLSLFIELNKTLGLEFIDNDSLEISKDLTFNFLFVKILKVISLDNECLFFIPSKNIFFMLSHDFNIYGYGKIDNMIADVFVRNHFNLLP